MKESSNIEIILPTENNIIQLETLRSNAYNNSNFQSKINSYYANQLRKNKYIVFAYIYEGEMVAACYVSNYLDSLYVEQLFVAKRYQEVGLHIGQKLLSYIIKHKDIVESHFNQELSYTKLSPNSDKSYNIYKKMGYRLIHKSLNVFGKRI